MPSYHVNDHTFPPSLGGMFAAKIKVNRKGKIARMELVYVSTSQDDLDMLLMELPAGLETFVVSRAGAHAVYIDPNAGQYCFDHKTFNCGSCK